MAIFRCVLCVTLWLKIGGGFRNNPNPPPNFSLGHKRTLYDYVSKVYCGQILNTRGEQFSEPQDGPQGHYRLEVPPPAVNLGTTLTLVWKTYIIHY
jgi:hypothetical protein